MKNAKMIPNLYFYVFVSFLVYVGGDSSGGRQTRNGVAVCSQKRALCVTAIVLAALLGTALVIAYAGPQNGKSKKKNKPFISSFFCYFVVNIKKYYIHNMHLFTLYQTYMNKHLLKWTMYE